MSDNSKKLIKALRKIVKAGFSSWRCPFCGFDIMNYHAANENKAWASATQIEKNGILQGLYDGYGKIDAFDVYLFAGLEGAIPEDELEIDNLLDPRDQEGRERLKKAKEVGIARNDELKIYHTVCYEKAGKPSFTSAKVSGWAEGQGHWIPDYMKDIDMKKTPIENMRG